MPINKFTGNLDIKWSMKKIPFKMESHLDPMKLGMPRCVKSKLGKQLVPSLVVIHFRLSFLSRNKLTYIEIKENE